ncbi:GGDEF domain-containing protein [Vibrio ostreicida]|uniref:Diguanylate cyclase DosC n=1 Tax=Vibrio ostreicida TaxID=526588 RepID=A0ABT8BT83_9VIBR|nr:GGDEF domain-containing protein [Vibrio ostreicida]MDN3609883.1 GGDEF domain-containing protein [Vibrio ostreicida]NPD10003.1 GGDEF domain-containing protein [Vibrio ostreicida]
MRITDKSLVEQQHISDNELMQRLRLFRLTPSDLCEIHSIKNIISRELDQIVDEFYEHQTHTPDVETLIGDSGTLKRLIAALRQYIIDLFSKDIDLDYVEHRLRIGLVHKRIGIDPKLYLSAVNYLKNTLILRIKNNINDESYADKLCGILERLIDFDVSYVFDTYIKSMMNEIEIERNKSNSYVADLESIVLERTKDLKEMTRLDSLTNLYNKRAFEEFSSKLFLESRQRGEPISLLYIDIDAFKAFNDLHGHEHGDNVLIAVSDSLRGVSRSVDLCFRMGGDEFVVVMPNCAKEDASLNYIPRLLEKLEAMRKDVSLSIGIAQSGPTNYLSCRDTLSRADKDMYLKKSVTHAEKSNPSLTYITPKSKKSSSQ